MILLETLKFVNYVWASLLLKMKLSLKSKFSAGWFPSSSHFLFTQFSSLLNWLLFHPRIWKHDDFVHCSMRCGLSHLLSVCTLERLHPMYADCLCWFLTNLMLPRMLIMLILDELDVPTYVDYADSWLVECSHICWLCWFLIGWMGVLCKLESHCSSAFQLQLWFGFGLKIKLLQTLCWWPWWWWCLCCWWPWS